MAKSVQFEEIHAKAAGIDVGSRGVFVSIDGEQAVNFKTFTSDYQLCCNYLKDNGIISAAMEATGVYRFTLYEMPEQHGIEVCPVHPMETRQVPGRKSDPEDCRRIQKIYSAGLLRESIVAKGELKELRMLTRERLDLIRMGSTYINRMQKYLELMNIKLRNVISQIHGAGGLRMIKAIIAGERDPNKLPALCHETIKKKKREDLLKSPEGNYHPTYIALLQENLYLYEQHRLSVRRIELQIQQLLEKLNQNNKQIEVTGPARPARHHNPSIPDLHTAMVQMFGGVNLTSIAGINDSTALRILGETGNDLSRFPTKKHFVSRVGLSPKNKQSGKMKKRVKCNAGNNAGLIFRQSAQSLLMSKNNATGVFMKRLKGRKGSKVAVKAGAGKIAEAFYDAITKGLDYVEQGTAKYIEQLKQKELKLLYFLSKKHNLVTPVYQPVT